MTITFAGAKEGKAQGNIVVALGVHALDGPAHAFIHPAIVPNQETARQGNMIKWQISVTENLIFNAPLLPTYILFFHVPFLSRTGK